MSWGACLHLCNPSRGALLLTASQYQAEVHCRRSASSAEQLRRQTGHAVLAGSPKAVPWEAPLHSASWARENPGRYDQEGTQKEL